MSEFFDLLEELVAVLEVHMSELLPSSTSNLLISVLPESRPEMTFEVLTGGL